MGFSKSQWNERGVGKALGVAKLGYTETSLAAYFVHYAPFALNESCDELYLSHLFHVIYVSPFNSLATSS